MLRREQFIDKPLIQKLKKGNKNAFKSLYKNYYHKAFSFSISYTKNSQEAEELVQEAFINIWEKRESIKENESFSNYLFSIIKNKIIDKIRKIKYQNEYKEYIEHCNELIYNKTEEDIIYNDLNSLTKQIIDSMPPRRKLIFKLSREEGYSYKEIAEQLNISVKTVENQMSFALKYIKQSLSN